MQISDIHHAYGRSQILNGISLEIFANETFVILGDSGCGKTTLLKIAAGLIAPDRGNIKIDDVDLTTLSPQQKNVVYLDQEALLFDHLTVEENVGFSLKIRKALPHDIKEKTSHLLEATGLGAHARKRSWQLSGGQKQRVAFARAILAEPKVLLLDEPFGALDSRTRQEMQNLYQRLASQYHFTALLVTHDIREALVLGHRFATMTKGTLTRYRNVAEFIHSESTGVQDEIQFWQSIQDQPT